MATWHGGKGSTPRKVDKEKFNNNWDKIFGKKPLDDIVNEIPVTTSEPKNKSTNT